MAALPFSYSIRRSQRAKKMRIAVSSHKIEVIAPPQIAEPLLHQFVSDHAQWIIDALQKVKHRQTNAPAPLSFQQGSQIAFQGVNYPLTLIPSPLKRIKIEFDNGWFVHLPNALIHTDCSEQIKIALIAWLKQQTQNQVTELVARHAQRHQLFPRSIIIKTQKSRWGSCGIHNDIHINWLLMMAPASVLEYVVVHELCHIQVRNHSARFWRLVAEHLPNYQHSQHWLKCYGGELMSRF